MVSRNIVGQKHMPFLEKLPKDILEGTAEEKLGLVSNQMREFQQTFKDTADMADARGDSYEPSLMTDEFRNRVLELAKEALDFYKQGKHLFMYKKYIDAIEALDIAARKLHLGIEMLWGLHA